MHATGRRAPTIELQSPEEGLEIALGERVLVQSVAQDDTAVLKSELWVDGRLYEVTRAQEEERTAHAECDPDLGGVGAGHAHFGCARL